MHPHVKLSATDVRSGEVEAEEAHEKCLYRTATIYRFVVDHCIRGVVEEDLKQIIHIEVRTPYVPQLEIGDALSALFGDTLEEFDMFGCLGLSSDEGFVGGA